MKPWQNRLARYTQTTITVVTQVAAIGASFPAFGGSHDTPLFGLVTASLCWVIAVTVHETGHCLGARVGGMTLWSMNVMGVEIHFMRRGWRWRWSSLSRRRIAGIVMAIDVLDRPLRRQRLWLCAGGPAANAILAIFSGLLAWLFLSGTGDYLLAALSIVNAGLALVNLVPHLGKLPSDGLQLLRLRKPVTAWAPEYAMLRLLANSMAGRTADQLPEEDLVLLEQQPALAPLIALWYRHKADQNRGHWAKAIAWQEPADAMIRQMDASTRDALADFVNTLQFELAFSRTMQTGDLAYLRRHTLDAKAAWLSPWLPLRRQALEQLLGMNAEQCHGMLAHARLLAGNSKDRSAEPSEALLHGHMLERYSLAPA
ncbi:M50 family metallopeptidase [Dyella telluris]|uniref:M50 family metallopeptidase n=1 Tax=Dyella telluris TaxID=2763498 RepID=A0A7G8Q2Z7_9GAMM|nr:M50 family metallopeptidase [Dyella telluris]QNK01155.1 M50 family metallopeptidase [Dyella telluris]